MTPLYDFDIACSVQTPTQIDLTPIIWIAIESSTTYLSTLIDNLLNLLKYLCSYLLTYIFEE